MVNRVVILLAAFVVFLSVALFRPEQAAAQIPMGNLFRIYPYVLTTTPTVLCGGVGGSGAPCGKDVYVCQADINSAAGTAATVTITDNQATPGSFWPGLAVLSGTAASSYKIFEGSPLGTCRFFPQGIQVSASGGAISLMLAGYYY